MKNHIPWNIAILSGISFSVPSLSKARSICFSVSFALILHWLLLWVHYRKVRVYIHSLSYNPCFPVVYFQFSSQGVFQNHESDDVTALSSVCWGFPFHSEQKSSPHNGLWGLLCSAACTFSSHPLLPLVISPIVHSSMNTLGLPCPVLLLSLTLGLSTSKIIFNLLICRDYWL